MPTVLYPPISFGIVEDGLYRSGIPQSINYEFLNSLRLRTVIILSPNVIDQALAKYFETNRIELRHVGKALSDVLQTGLCPITEDIVTDSLKIVAENSNYPVLIICKTGRFLTGVTIACLRKLQKWSYVSIYEEYRRYSLGRIQSQQEEFIEMYDSELIGIKESSPLFLRR